MAMVFHTAGTALAAVTVLVCTVAGSVEDPAAHRVFADGPVAPMRDTALLQIGGSTRKGGLTCETCADIFHAMDGCADNMAAKDSIAQRPEFAGCDVEKCRTELATRCGVSPSHRSTPTCETCADVFVAQEGCESGALDDTAALQTLFGRPEYAGCDAAKCRTELTGRCAGLTQQGLRSHGEHTAPTCETCADVFAARDGCEGGSLGDPAALAVMLGNPELAGCDAEKCQAELASVCAESSRVVQEVDQPVSRHDRPTCRTCADVFVARGGCESGLLDDAAALRVLLGLAELAGCDDPKCLEEMKGSCSA